MSGIKNVAIHTQVLVLLLTAFTAAFSTPLSADSLNVCTNNKNTGNTESLDCQYVYPWDFEKKDEKGWWWVESPENSTNFWAVPIRSIFYDSFDSGSLRGKACVCPSENEPYDDCIKVRGSMYYLGRAYDANDKFNALGFNDQGECGTDAPTINGRRAGYLRLISHPGNCIQSTGDPANYGSTHLWEPCATGLEKSQKRRVITYDTQNHQLQFASDRIWCLVAQPLPTPPNGFPAPPITPIVVRRCAEVPSAQRNWEIAEELNNLVRLKSDVSKCMVTTETSKGSAIVLGDCSVGARAQWQLTWTQHY